MGDIIQRLVELTEQHFDCRPGMPMVFFEIPQRIGDDIRLVYDTYAARGDNIDELEQWFIDSVIVPLYEKTDGMGRLWWRLAECFEVELVTWSGKPLEYHLRTRIAVTDKDLNVVRLDDVIKLEGDPVKVITCP